MDFTATAWKSILQNRDDDSLVSAWKTIMVDRDVNSQKLVEKANAEAQSVDNTADAGK